MQHLMVQQVFDGVARAGRAVKDPARHDRIVRGVVVAQQTLGMMLAPCRLRAAAQTMKESLVQNIEDFRSRHCLVTLVSIEVHARCNFELSQGGIVKVRIYADGLMLIEPIQIWSTHFCDWDGRTEGCATRSLCRSASTVERSCLSAFTQVYDAFSPRGPSICRYSLPKRSRRKARNARTFGEESRREGYSA
jgi:hypothetical protein